MEDIDHYAWLGPCEALQKWFQKKLIKYGKYTRDEVNTWKRIIAILKKHKQTEHAEFAQRISNFCQKMDHHRGKAPKGQDLQQKTLKAIQDQLDQFVKNNVETNSQRPYALIQRLRSSRNVLFDQRFRGRPQLLRFNNQRQMEMFQNEVRYFSEASLTWIYDHNQISLDDVAEDIPSWLLGVGNVVQTINNIFGDRRQIQENEQMVKAHLGKK